MFHLVCLIWLWGETKSSDHRRRLRKVKWLVCEHVRGFKETSAAFPFDTQQPNILKCMSTCLPPCLFSDSYLAVRRRVNPVMVDPPLVPQRYGPLPGAALALADQEAPVDARAEQVLGGVARHGPVVPAVLLQAVDGGDVVGRHPALAILGLRLAPLAVVVVTEHTQLLS